MKRLERELKNLKEEYDSLKIKQLTFHGTENDPVKVKNDANKLEALKKEIKKKEEQILEIKLDLKWWLWEGLAINVCVSLIPDGRE